MKNMLKHYFTHPSVITYFAIDAAILTYLLSFNILNDLWWVLFIPIAIAPFYEWIIHKFVLHNRIGNRVSIDRIPGKEYKIDDTFMHLTTVGEKEFYIVEIQEEIIIAADKNPAPSRWNTEFMEKLHYGHHKDPDYIPYIFAPIGAIIIMFAALFLLAFAVCWNIDAAAVFTFSVILYYLHYEWMHLGHHVKGYKHLFPWNRKMAKLHSLHHYKNENYWWGITNSLGDRMLGTYKDHGGIERSKSVKDINA